MHAAHSVRAKAHSLSSSLSSRAPTFAPAQTRECPQKQSPSGSGDLGLEPVATYQRAFVKHELAVPTKHAQECRQEGGVAGKPGQGNTRDGSVPDRQSCRSLSALAAHLCLPCAKDTTTVASPSAAAAVVKEVTTPVVLASNPCACKCAMTRRINTRTGHERCMTCVAHRYARRGGRQRELRCICHEQSLS